MRLNKNLVLTLILGIAVKSACADPLILSDAQLQKLQHFFLAQTDSAQFVWKGDPISINLPINHEKRILFSVPVTADLKGVLTTDQLRIINNDQSLYLTALKPFSTTRLYVTLQNSGKVVLIDLSTNDNADNTTVRIATPSQQSNLSQNISQTLFNNSDSLSAQESTTSDSSNSDDYVTLIRFAWQQLYAPERLLKNPLGITRAPMHTEPKLSGLIYGDKVYAHPDASWVSGNTYVTAIELRNKYPHITTIHLDRDLCGHWQAATLYPRSLLKPAGNQLSDSTELFVISSKPFGDSMELCNGGA